MVEDDAEVHSVVVRMLTRLGYRVAEAADGPTALALLSDHDDVDLLFSDVVMPGGIDGKELWRRARALHPDLRVVFSSGYSEDVIDADEDIADVAAIVRKPVARDVLARIVRNTLDAPRSRPS